MSDDEDPEHCSEVFQLDEGDTVTLVLDDGSELEATLDEKSEHHDESGPHITTQTTLKLTRESDGIGLTMGRLDGLSGLPDADPFPSFFPLHESELVEGHTVTEEHTLGYVNEIQQ